MNTEKKQHFVPKLYLRNFSIRQEGKQLSVFNTQSDQWIPNASLKGQAQKNFFYGKIEDRLGETENEVAPLLRKITFENYVPLPGSDDHCTLYRQITPDSMSFWKPIERNCSSIIA